MSDKIEPALTPEEWRRAIPELEAHTVTPPTVLSKIRAGERVKPQGMQGFAAVCLYSQPFGFTREDVKTLRWAAKALCHFQLTTLADRIEALLPPARREASH